MSSEDDDEPRTHYHYRVRLRVFHPSIAPEKITEAFEIEPSHSWKAGDARRTPVGTPLSGIYRETYWTACVVAGRWPELLNAAVHDALGRLARHRSFLHQIRAEGGRAEFFIGWFFEN